MTKKNYILSVAGLDPSNGAGLTADMKTFHAHQLYGLSVCTGVTVQNDREFISVQWIDTKTILDQIKVLYTRFAIPVVKIGMVKDWGTLLLILQMLREQYTPIQIILDPILKVTAGYTIHKDITEKTLVAILEKIDWIIPNYEELQSLYSEKSVEKIIAYISSKTNLFLKGGHREDLLGVDQLFYNTDKKLDLFPSNTKVWAKHGSGCVLSSAFASNLALGNTIERAAVLSKKYIEQFLNSTEDLLGYHYPIKE